VASATPKLRAQRLIREREKGRIVMAGRRFVCCLIYRLCTRVCVYVCMCICVCVWERKRKEGLLSPPEGWCVLWFLAFVRVYV
jgi:hypothetical protein